MTMCHAVTLSNILIKRGFRTLLDIEQLVLPTGSFTGLVGPNGAGKTTLLKLCCGLIRPNQGTVCLNDQCISNTRPWRIAGFHRHIGYIPQQAEYNAHLPFTLREVVAMGRNASKPLFGSLDKSDYEKTDHWIAELGLYEHRNQTFRSLSGGQQQKTLIARAMVSKPQLVLLDEPGANLDPNWKKQLRDILDRLFAIGSITVLLVSHELGLIPESCQRLILLDRGHILTQGEKEMVLGSEFAKNLFGELNYPEKKD